MKKHSTIAAIDVGTTKVCTIIADADSSNGIRVLGVGITPTQGLAKGLVVNIGDARESIRASVKKAEQSGGVKVESAFIGVTGRHVQSMNNRGVVAINRGDRLVRSDDLKRVLNCARSVRVPDEQKLLHVIPRNYAVDGQTGVRNPVGMHGFRLDVETHIITAAAASVQNLVKCVRGIGIDIDDLVLEPLASAEAILTDDEKSIGVVMADIGGGTTDVAVFRDGSIWHTSILPVAGYQITRDVAIGLGLPFEVAEEMKKRYGSVMPVDASRMETPQAMSQDSHGVSYQDLCEIVRARVEEVLRLIMLELPSSDYDMMIPAGLVLTGGGANLNGIATLGRDMLQMPVRAGIPNRNVEGITDALMDPSYATSVGLLLWGQKNQNRNSWRGNLFGSNFKRFMGRFRKVFV